MEQAASSKYLQILKQHHKQTKCLLDQTIRISVSEKENMSYCTMPAREINRGC
jgi:hypothetical protein